MGLKQELDFRLPDIDGELKVVYAPCLMKVYLDGRKLKRDGRKGYEVTTVNGEKTYFKLTVDFTLAHVVEYRGRKIKLESPLSTWEYIVGGIPFLLIFAGGLLGVLCGFIGVTYTYGFMRHHRSVPAKIGGGDSLHRSLLFRLFSLRRHFHTFVRHGKIACRP